MSRARRVGGGGHLVRGRRVGEGGGGAIFVSSGIGVVVLVDLLSSAYILSNTSSVNRGEDTLDRCCCHSSEARTGR